MVLYRLYMTNWNYLCDAANGKNRDRRIAEQFRPVCRSVSTCVDLCVGLCRSVFRSVSTCADRCFDDFVFQPGALLLLANRIWIGSHYMDHVCTDLYFSNRLLLHLAPKLRICLQCQPPQYWALRVQCSAEEWLCAGLENFLHSLFIYLFIYLFHQIHIHIIQSLMNDELLRWLCIDEE